MLDWEGFRPNVGIILLNQRNQVFWGKRIRSHSWQFPQGGIDRGESPEQAMYRELHEEVVLHTTFTERCVGLINDDATEVGRVHLGIVHRLDVDEPNVVSNESDLIEAGFMPLEELRNYKNQMESWSAISLEMLFGECGSGEGKSQFLSRWQTKR